MATTVEEGEARKERRRTRGERRREFKGWKSREQGRRKEGVARQATVCRVNEE